jgi:hypothetical protein
VLARMLCDRLWQVGVRFDVGDVVTPTDRLWFVVCVLGAALVGIAAGLISGPWPS